MFTVARENVWMWLTEAFRAELSWCVSNSKWWNVWMRERPGQTGQRWFICSRVKTVKTQWWKCWMLSASMIPGEENTMRKLSLCFDAAAITPMAQFRMASFTFQWSLLFCWYDGSSSSKCMYTIFVINARVFIWSVSVCVHEMVCFGCMQVVPNYLWTWQTFVVSHNN